VKIVFGAYRHERCIDSHTNIQKPDDPHGSVLYLLSSNMQQQKCVLFEITG